MNTSRKQLVIGIVAVVLIALSIWQLERERAGLEITSFDAGTTPVTLYKLPKQNGPIVVVAHGFAGSRQIMQAYSLPLAQAGYRVFAFDFEGHGGNPIPMSGDVTSVDGTTALLVAETRRVIAAARTLPEAEQIALLGHSMATDIIVRASIAETQAGQPVEAVVAISMFSQAVTAEEPARLLVISGQWESFLRKAGLDAVHLVDPNTGEGDLAVSGSVTRRAVVAPAVEHVGVLFSPTAVDEARDWLDATFARDDWVVAAGHRGWWILALLAGIVTGFYPIVSLLPKRPAAPQISTRRFLLATLGPAVVAPLLITPFYENFLPVLVADYVMLHLAVFGTLQVAILGKWSGMRWGLPILPVAALTLWGIFVFGLALDRYAASFWPTPERLPIIAALCLGTIPFMVADSYVTQAGRSALWRRFTARILLFLSLGIAAMLDPENLTFVLIVLPVFVLFFLVHGLMGRWIGRQSGAIAAGMGLGICLAWALGVSFPLFANS
ncbi:MAG: alpha/beta fold hydrolase [Gemmobacter sp.]|nr:alpha/beta fold hydrolase [Gemmobacter sp.]